MSPVTRCLVRPDTYRDSVLLMRVAAQLEHLPGVESGAADGYPRQPRAPRRGRPARRGSRDRGPGRSRRRRHRGRCESGGCRPRLGRAPPPPIHPPRRPPRPPGAAHDRRGRRPPRREPGHHLDARRRTRTAEALKALKRGLHVLLFSDNVPIEDEIELKRLARTARGLLVMGPDCGTAILDGVPLGFANAVRRGRIGLVGGFGHRAPAGDLPDRPAGEGVSQVIGAAATTSRARRRRHDAARHRAAGRDPATEVIVLISKPPAAAVARRVLARLARPASRSSSISSARSAAPIEAPAPSRRRRWRTPRGWPWFWPAETAAADRPAIPARGAPRAGRSREASACARPLQRRDALLGGELILAARCRGSRPHRDRPRRRRVHGRAAAPDDRLPPAQRAHPAAAEDPTTAVILLDIVLGYGAIPIPPARPAGHRRGARPHRAGAPWPSWPPSAAPRVTPRTSPSRSRAFGGGRMLAPSNAQAVRLAARLVGRRGGP